MLEFFWPRVAVEPRRTSPECEPYVRSYLFMRLFVGVLGIALPVLIVLGQRYLFDGRPFLRGSVSSYYYSGMREVFVGGLCAIGIFLVTYKVAERSRENRLSIYAGIAVVIVALFPTGRPGEGVPLTPLQDWLSEEWVQGIHFGAAVIFIVSLAVICFYFAKPPPTPAGSRSKEFWHRYHLLFAGLIALGLVLAFLEGVTGWPDRGLLIGEVLAVWAFGASWFMKGFEIDVLLGRHREESATAIAAKGSLAGR